MKNQRINRNSAANIFTALFILLQAAFQCRKKAPQRRIGVAALPRGDDLFLFSRADQRHEG